MLSTVPLALLRSAAPTGLVAIKNARVEKIIKRLAVINFTSVENGRESPRGVAPI
jgi:hypothetical protein